MEKWAFAHFFCLPKANNPPCFLADGGRVLPIEIENRLDEIRSQVEALGAELVDIRFYRGGGRSLPAGRQVLTILADKPGGITLEECAKINRELGVYFEFLEGSFIL